MSGSRIASVAAQNFRIDTSSANISSSAYTQLTATVAGEIIMAHIYNGTTSSLKIANGPAGSEVDIININPGMDMNVPFHVSKNSRLAIKAIATTASSGEFIMTLFI